MRLTALAAIFAVAVFTACADGGGSGPTPTIPVTRTPEPGLEQPPCPVNPTACQLAGSLQGWLKLRNIEGILGIHEQRAYDCPGGRPPGPGGPYPLCDGQRAGERLTGVHMARRYSEGFVVSPPDYIRIVGQLVMAADAGASDSYGPGEFQLYGVTCAAQGAPAAGCPRFGIIFSAILRPAQIPPLGTVPGREVLVFFVTQVPGQQPQITETWTGIIMPNELQVVLRDGGTLFDLGRVYPYRLP
jgi:hypothetical protein